MRYLWILGYVVVLVSLETFVHDLELPWFATLPALAFIAVADQVVELQPRVAARIFVARRQVTYAFSGTLVVVSLLAFALNRPPSLPSYVDITVFTLQGALVGIILRVLLTAFFARRLRDAPTSVQRLMILFSVAIFICLFPIEHTHRHLASLYMFGTGIGFYLHYRIRGKEHEKARLNRYLQNIISVLARADEELRPIESQAIGEYANHRWNKLNRILAGAEVSNTRLQLVRAAERRLRGKYDEAVDILVKALKSPGKMDSLDSHVYLQLALNYGEKGDYEEMWRALQSAKSVDASCLLLNVTLALREAEDITSREVVEPNDEVKAKQDRVLQRMWSALQLYEIDPAPRLLALVVGATVPVTWTFLVDAYGYALLKSGRHRFARSLFLQCIYDDPTFASPYLHLAEWLLIDRLRRELAQGDIAQEGDPTHLAELCLHIALGFEGSRRSLIAHRAKKVLHELNA